MQLTPFQPLTQTTNNHSVQTTLTTQYEQHQPIQLQSYSHEDYLARIPKHKRSSKGHHDTKSELTIANSNQLVPSENQEAQELLQQPASFGSPWSHPSKPHVKVPQPKQPVFQSSRLLPPTGLMTAGGFCHERRSRARRGPKTS